MRVPKKGDRVRVDREEPEVPAVERLADDLDPRVAAPDGAIARRSGAGDDFAPAPREIGVDEVMDDSRTSRLARAATRRILFSAP